MKKIVIILVNLFLSLFMYAQNIPYFSYDCIIGGVYDYKTGNDMVRIDDYTNLNSKKSIKQVKIKQNNLDENKINDYELILQNGLEITYKTYIHNHNTYVKEYDELNRLSMTDNLFTYKYFDDNKRNVYYKGNINYEEEISHTDNTFQIIRKSYVYSVAKNDYIYYGTDISNYKYENNNLIEYNNSSWNWKNVKSEFVKKVIYEYNQNQKLVKIINGYEGGDIRLITNISYDEKGNMSEIHVTNLQGEEQYREYFYNYDAYGNWTKSEKFYKDSLDEIIEREITYLK